jgi:ribulose-bisphosphate carboxylase small chain
MHLTQGTFSYLPPLTADEIAAQIRYALGRGWSVSIEHSDDPHPRNIYWEMFGLPLFDVNEVPTIIAEINRCRGEYPNHYVRVNAYDRSRGRQTIGLSFIVNRPAHEPSFRLERTEFEGRGINYTLHTVRE